jgi:hypothetical protein
VAGRRRRLAVAAACWLLPVSLAGCAHRDAAAYARQACRYVESSLAAWARARSDPDPAAAARQRLAAQVDLRDALPLAALAASDDSQWQALATTISESTRVDEGLLVHALAIQCAQVARPG